MRLPVAATAVIQYGDWPTFQIGRVLVKYCVLMPEVYRGTEELLLIWVVMGVVAFWAWALVVVVQLAVMVVALLLEPERVGFG